MVPAPGRQRGRRAATGARGYTSSCAAPPTGRWLRTRAAPAPAPHRPPAVPAALRARRRRVRRRHPPEQAPEAARAGPGQARHLPASRGRGCEAAERRHRADGAVAHRGERQARHAELDLQPQPARARARGLRQPGQRGARRRRGGVRQQHRPGRAGPGLPHGLLPGPRWPPHRADRLRPGQGPGRAGGHARHRHGHLPVVAHADAQHHEGLATRLLPLEARRRRRRGAVRPPHRPRRRVQGVVRVPEQCHHLAGLQPVGQLQPLLRARQRRSGRISPAAPAPCPSTVPTRRPGPRARPTSSATSSPCSSTSRASGWT